MTQILLIGSGGQVGQELQKTLTRLGRVSGVDRTKLDLTQPNEIRRLIADQRPNLVVNAAAYTAVDKAEAEVELANAVNATAPTVMAEAAQQVGVPLIHISTDYVFDGRKNIPYTEEDVPNPLGEYGRSKWLGEEGIRQVYANAANPQYAIVRTAWVYGAYGKSNFVKTMLRLGAERDEVRVVFDQVGTPTCATEIARTIASLSQRFLNQTNGLSNQASLSGLYHLTNSGVTSWYDFAVEIFEEAKSLGFPIKLRRVIPITTAEYPTPAQRPAYSVLSCQKITTLLNAPPLHWRQGLRQMLTELYAGTYESNYSLRR
jgi:dTDP-4-dehydrorhamnose reductase